MEFKEHLKKYLSNEEIDELMSSLELENKHAVLLNLNKMSNEKFISLFPNVIPHPIVKNAYLYDKNEYNLGKSIYHLLGCFYLQEPSAMVPAYLLDADETDLVLDMCAAPGGKSIQTSFKMNNNGAIISNDLSKSRAMAILENVERLGIENIVISNNDFSLIKDKYSNYFTKIILDAPCSGSGMFRKNENVKNDWTYEKVIKCQEIQKQLILSAYYMLKPGGSMVYSTCSFSMEEDEDVISYLLDNTDAEIIDINMRDLSYTNKIKPLGIHLFPNKFPGEGHYICLIKKPGELIRHKIEYKENKFGDYLFLSPDINIRHLNVIRDGLKVGEISKDVIKYDYHYAHYLSSFENEINFNNNLTYKYLNGDTINQTSNKGFILIKYDGISLDIAKSDGMRIKNRLPSRIRLLNKVIFNKDN